MTFGQPQERSNSAVAKAITTVLEPATNARMALASRHRAVREFDYDLLARTLRASLEQAC